MKFDFNRDPLQNFEFLFNQAETSLPKDANAMTLATVSPQGQPSTRTVLFKGMVRGGFSFYTNYHSEKARDMQENPKVSALFFWSALEQQIRIGGRVEKLSESESEAYFASRPRISQIGAWASDQSQRILSFDVLEEKVQQIDKKFQGRDIPKPPHWGGYILIPTEIEFWFSRPGRLHERYVYSRPNENQPWEKFLKSP